jgi:hypothetical protein
MSQETFLCKDCKHCFVTPTDAILYAFDWNNKHRYSCRKSWSEPKIDNLVVGSTSKGFYYTCSAARIGKSVEGNCGQDAFYWEPKDKRNLFKFMMKVERDASTSNS